MRRFLRQLTRPLWLLPVAALGGGLACWLAGSGYLVEPAMGELAVHRAEFVMTREPEDALLVTEATWRPIPYLFEDFDLTCDVDLSPGAELDLLFRVVEPRMVQGVVLPFHARFTLLRMTTRGEGPPYRSREQALFDQTLGGGVDLAPGHPATVLLQGRGSLVRANVAGRWLPWVHTADDHGSFAFIVRGGQARIPALRIRPVPRGGGIPTWLAGGAAGLLLAGLALALGGHRGRLLLLPVLVLAIGWAGKRMVFGDLLPLAAPAWPAVLWVGLAGLPLGVLLALPLGSQRWAMPLGLLAVLGCWDVAARGEAPRRQGFEDPRLDLVLGRASGTAPLEALARRVRGPYGVHTLAERQGPRVFFLGGQLLYGLAKEEDLTVWSTAELGLKRGGKVEGLSLPTVDGHALQQWLMFWGYYRDFAPDVLVFGVAEGEMAEDPRGDAAALLARTLLLTPAGFAMLPWSPPAGLLGLLPTEPPAPRSSPANLARVLEDVKRYCKERGHALAFLTGAGVPDELRQVVAAAAGDAVPVIDLEGASLAERVRRTVRVLEGLLR